MELSEEVIFRDGSHTVLIPIQKLQLVLSLCGSDGVLSHEWIRNRQDAARRDSGERIRQLANNSECRVTLVDVFRETSHSPGSSPAFTTRNKGLHASVQPYNET